MSYFVKKMDASYNKKENVAEALFIMQWKKKIFFVFFCLSIHQRILKKTMVST